ncbi:MAG: AI-2E family transporter [Actinobacteria bacterium]|nr:AI-2E family transporter [Actinomycetota bacterium]
MSDDQQPTPAPPYAPETAVPPALRRAAALSWRFLLVAAALVVLAVVAARLRVIVLPVLFALFAAAILAPPTVWLRRHGTHPTIAALLVFVGSLAVVATVVALVAPRAVNELGDVSTNVQAGFDRVTDWVLDGPLEISQADLQDYRERALDELRERAGSIAGGALGGAYLVVELIAGLLLGLVLLFFFLKDGERMWPWIVGLFPERARRNVDEVGQIGWRTLGGYLRGQTIVALVDAIFIGLALWLIGVPLVLPLAVLTFVGGFFPIVGAFAAGAAAALVALVTKGVTAALLVVAATIAVQQIEGNLLQPFIVGRAVQLHPIAVLLAVAAGAVVWGVPGAIIAVPLVAVIAQSASYLRSGAEPAERRRIRRPRPPGRAARAPGPRGG